MGGSLSIHAEGAAHGVAVARGLAPSSSSSSHGCLVSERLALSTQELDIGVDTNGNGAINSVKVDGNSVRANLSKQPAVLTFGAINGGIRYNIIPDEVEMVGTIRTFDEGMRQQIFADLRNVAEHTAAAHGAKAVTDIYESEGNPATVNDPALTAKMLPSLQAVVGKDNVYEPPLQMGAEDFSLYAKEVPGMFFFVGSTSVGIDPATAPANHSPKFLLDEKALDVGFRALMQVSLDYLNGAATPAG